MKSKRNFLLGWIFAILFLLLIRGVCFADVAPIGPEGTRIGFSRLNGWVFEGIGVHLLWYEITDWLGLIAIATALFFAIVGLVQLLKRKSLKKVDREIWILAGFYLIVLGLYVLFENAIVNYRPIIMPGCETPEASFPSSHTMLVLTVMGSAGILAGRYVTRPGLRVCLRVLCALIIAVTVAGRLISGVHWFTDILGGILVSAALLSLFSGALRTGKSE